jgi:hypothetical protein
VRNAICDRVSCASTVRCASVHDVSAFVAEVANELATWPGVRIDRRSNGAAIVTYEHSELGALYPDRGHAASTRNPRADRAA